MKFLTAYEDTTDENQGSRYGSEQKGNEAA
jgi:hypothetical protein